MLKGKSVWLGDPANLKVFYPKSLIFKEFPLIVPAQSIFITKISPFPKYPDSIWIHRACDFNLEDKETLKAVVNSFKKIPEKYAFVFDLSIEDIWKFTKEFLFLGTSITYSMENESNIYSLFRVLDKTNSKIYRAYSEINAPQNVILSSLLTMLTKMKNRNEFVGVVSAGYSKDLLRLSRTLKNIKVKWVNYILSPQQETDTLSLLFSLRK